MAFRDGLLAKNIFRSVDTEINFTLGFFPRESSDARQFLHFLQIAQLRCGQVVPENRQKSEPSRAWYTRFLLTSAMAHRLLPLDLDITAHLTAPVAAHYIRRPQSSG
jgi:hypothetical protein